jgi:hypothetical protein
MTASLPASAGEEEPGLPLLRYHASMPAPTNERQALERERAELPAHVAHYQRELDATPHESKERRERLMWQVRRVQKRTVEADALLTGGEKLGHPQQHAASDEGAAQRPP